MDKRIDMTNDINLPKHISGCGEYGKSHLAGQKHQAEIERAKIERIREYVKDESACGVMRSMENTIRSNAMSDVLHYIDRTIDEGEQ